MLFFNNLSQAAFAVAASDVPLFQLFHERRLNIISWSEMQFTPRHMKAQRHDGGVHACFEEQAMWVNGTIPQTNFSILSIIDPKGYPTMLLPLPFSLSAFK